MVDRMEPQHTASRLTGDLKVIATEIDDLAIDYRNVVQPEVTLGEYIVGMLRDRGKMVVSRKHTAAATGEGFGAGWLRRLAERGLVVAKDPCWTAPMGLYRGECVCGEVRADPDERRALERIRGHVEEMVGLGEAGHGVKGLLWPQDGGGDDG